MTKVKKSFKKYAAKHLAGHIERRRKTAKSRKEMKERRVAKEKRTEATLKREEEQHQEQLKQLGEADPELYAYLQEEDPSLLQFGLEEVNVYPDSDAGSDAETDVDAEEGAGNEESEEQQQSAYYTDAEVDGLIRNKAAASLIDVVVAAARTIGCKGVVALASGRLKRFESTTDVKRILVKAAKAVASTVSTIAGTTDAFKTPTVRSRIKALAFVVVELLQAVASDEGIVVELLRVLAALVPVLHFIRGATKAVLRATLSLCSSDVEAIRVAAYVCVRAMASRSAGKRTPYQSAAFKGLYLALVRASHNFSARALPITLFLMSSVVDLYGTDVEAAYQHTFVFLRQLAAYLKSALAQPTAANVRAVCSWQFVQSLRVWAMVVSTYGDAKSLGALIHPVVELGLGVLELFASPRMVPLHLHIVSILNRVATMTGVAIPVVAYLMRILTAPSMALGDRGRAGGDGVDTDVRFILRARKGVVAHPSYRAAVWKEALFLLVEDAATNAHRVAFPEMFWQVLASLRELKRTVRVPALSATLAQLIHAIEAQAKVVTAQREGIVRGPCDVAAVRAVEEGLREQKSPLRAIYATMRQSRVDAAAEIAASRRRPITLEAATTEARKRKRSASAKRRPVQAS